MNHENPRLSYPVKRMGNEENPKLVILLSHPGGNPENLEELAEPEMEKMKSYSDTGMDLKKEREVCNWLQDLLNITDNYEDKIKESDILMLQYYSYHHSGIPHLDNDDLRGKIRKNIEEARNENIQILKKLMKNDVLVFACFCRRKWEDKIPELSSYKYYDYSRSKCRRLKPRLGELDIFLEKHLKK